MQTAVPDWVGDDGNGCCRGCGVSLDDGVFTDGCAVCAAAYLTVMGWD